MENSFVNNITLRLDEYEAYKEGFRNWMKLKENYDSLNNGICTFPYRSMKFMEAFEALLGKER